MGLGATVFSRIPGSLLIPEDHMDLVDAIQFIGKRFFDDCWTGTDEFKTKIVVPPPGQDQDGYDDTGELLIPVADGVALLQTTTNPFYLFSEDQDVIDLKRGDGFVSELTPEERLSQVLKLLRRELVEGKISSHILCLDGSRWEVPDHFWSGIPAMGVLRSGAIDPSTTAIINRVDSSHAPVAKADGIVAVRDLLAEAAVGYLFFPKEDIKTIGEDPSSRTKRSSAKAESDCRKWLIKLIKDSPQDAIYINDQLLPEAQSKFPGLSKNAFGRAKAIAAEKFPAWTKKGRRPFK